MYGAKGRNGWRRAAALGALVACVYGAGCSVRSRAAELYPEVAEYSGREIDKVVFVGPGPFDTDTLRQIVETQSSHCDLLGLPICIPFTGIGRETRRVDVATVVQDAARLAIFYRRSGYFGTVVDPEVEPVVEGDEAGKVAVRFGIRIGEPVYLDTLTISGTEGVVDPDSMLRILPLEPGELFNLVEFDRSADTLLTTMLRRGYAYAKVLRNYDVVMDGDYAVADLTAIPGPRVVVDSIVVQGADHLGRDATLRQLAFREGSVLRADELIRSQRNLYTIELVQFASVDLAPDSLQAVPGDSSRATVLVQLAEAPVHAVEASVGFGTVECLRTQARWVSRSFPSGAQRLAVTGSVSKLGLAGSTDVGFGGLCRAFEGDPFKNDLDYRLAADFTRPYLFGPSNQLVVAAHVDRQSEPGVFQRESRGGQVAVTRRIGLRDALTGAVEVERGRTDAATAVFCLALQVCRPTEAEAATQWRWRNRFKSAYVRDRTERVVSPSSGSLLRLTADWATPLLVSDVDFVRTAAEGAVYRSLRPGWVAAGFLRLGNIFGSSIEVGDEFLPPEDRFYAGGANSVRGFGRNEMGPGAWVISEEALLEGRKNTASEFIPAGGTSVAVASAELRFPSPFLPRFVRLAAFVDAGVVDTTSVWTISPSDLDVTPGVGLRLQTPVGPIRFDVAYNPNSLPKGPLFVTDEEDPNQLLRVEDDFAPGRHGFFDRLRFHLAVGQAF